MHHNARLQHLALAVYIINIDALHALSLPYYNLFLLVRFALFTTLQ